MPTEALGFTTFSPKMDTDPLSGNSKPEINRVSVDFPQPDGPTTAVKLFFGKVSERFFKTGSGPV